MIGKINSYSNYNLIKKTSINNQCKKIDRFDNISFKGDVTNIVFSNNPYNAKQLMLIPINNWIEKAEGFLAKAMMNVFKGLWMIAQPDTMLKDKDTISILSTRGFVITGGIIARKKPHNKTLDILMLTLDEKNYGRKDRIKMLYKLGESVCEKCKRENITNIEWSVNSKDKNIVNLYNKFAECKSKNDKLWRYSTSTDRLKDFLKKEKLKHKRFFN